MQDATSPRRFQYSLKTLLLLVTAAGLGCALARLIGWNVSVAFLFGWLMGTAPVVVCSAWYRLWQKWHEKQEIREKRQEQEATRALLELAGVRLGDKRLAIDVPDATSPSLQISKSPNQLA